MAGRGKVSGVADRAKTCDAQWDCWPLIGSGFFVGFHKLLFEKDALLGNACDRLAARAIRSGCSRIMLRKENTLFFHLCAVRLFAGLTAVTVSGALGENNSFPSLARPIQFFTGPDINCFSNSFWKKEPFFVHCHLSQDFPRFSASDNRHFVGKQEAAFFDRGIKSKWELVSQRSNGTLDQQRIVLTFFAPCRQIPTAFLAFELKIRGEAKRLTALNARDIFCSVFLLTVIAETRFVFPIRANPERLATDFALFFAPLRVMFGFAVFAEFRLAIPFPAYLDGFTAIVALFFIPLGVVLGLTTFAKFRLVLPLPTNPHSSTALFALFLIPFGIMSSLATFAEFRLMLPLSANPHCLTAFLTFFFIPFRVPISFAGFAKARG